MILSKNQLFFNLLIAKVLLSLHPRFMDFQKTFQNVLDILQLKEPTIQAVARDPEATKVAWVAVAAGALATSLGLSFFPVHMGVVVYRPDLFWILQQAVVEALVMLGALYGAGFVGEKWFHSKVDMQGFVRVVGHAAFLGVLNLVPVLGILCVWELVVLGFLQARVGKLQNEALILFFIVSFLLVAVLSAFGQSLAW